MSIRPKGISMMKILVLWLGMLSFQAHSQNSVTTPETAALRELVSVISAQPLATSRLRLVFEEKNGPAPLATVKTPTTRHHVLWIDPSLTSYRYDFIDFTTSNKSPYVMASFTDGHHQARCDGAVRPASLEKILNGQEDSIRENSFCYRGPSPCRTPDIILRVLGLTTVGMPMGQYLEKVQDTKDFEISQDQKGGWLIKGKSWQLTFDASGILQHYLRTSAALVNPGNPGPGHLVEEITVENTARIGPVVVPSSITRVFAIPGEGIREEHYVLREVGSKVIEREEFEGASNPVLPPGVTLLPDQKGGTSTYLEFPTKAFAPDPAK
jgi:hypothetical protein